MRNILIALSLTSTAVSASAADGDFRTGSFGAIWCNYAAYLHVETKKSGSWRFDGKIEILKTGELDRLRVQQKDDNSLEITRYLSGKNTGKVQKVYTHPPIMKTDKMIFEWQRSSGIGCGTGTPTIVDVPN